MNIDDEDYAYEQYRQSCVDAGTWRPFNQLSETLLHETKRKQQSCGACGDDTSTHAKVANGSVYPQIGQG